jgi:thymidylate synthase
MVLPPCHYNFQLYTRELSEKERTVLYFEKYGYDSVNMEGNDLTGIPTRAISLMWTQRSVDTFLGLPCNIASYGLLLEIIAEEVNMVPDELIGNLGDVHLYNNHIKQAKEQISREPFELPQLSYLDEYHYLTDVSLVGEIPFNKKIEEFRPDFFKVVNYQSHPTIKAPLSN